MQSKTRKLLVGGTVAATSQVLQTFWLDWNYFDSRNLLHNNLTMGTTGRGGAPGRGGKRKPQRGGSHRFTPARMLREEGDVWNHPREKEDDEKSTSNEDTSSEEESSEDERPAPPKPKAPAGPVNPKLGNTQEDSDSEVEAAPKSKDLSNPNHSTKTHMKASDLGGERELSRREREAIAKEKAKAAFWKAQMEGKTEQARTDLARLAIIRKQREEAAKRKAEEAASKGKATGAKAESLNAGKGIIGKTLGKK
ncbi:casein kinase substrate phosphoprotein PP28-domain-containing protein [Phlyctochytrium arcticum]|nr:casein kinase substrate phosphoprotein PP28-domain-containing protein [Phlyctochytrium arcticum]